jgi:hypothetical protein
VELSFFLKQTVSQQEVVSFEQVASHTSSNTGVFQQIVCRPHSNMAKLQSLLQET